ncbi:hypothetical protein ACFQYP_54400 [Nonomuraea antimicrobica]
MFNDQPVAPAQPGSPDYDGIRQALRDDTSTPVISVRGLEVRVAVLPLFTHDGRQAVRVSSTEPLTHVLVGVDSASGRDVTLLVPEVDAPRVLTLECRDDAGVVGSAQVTVTPQRKWSVFVVHHSHLDIGYTDPQGTVLRHHLDYLDAAVRLAEETASWPDDARFRWSVESSMPALKWLDARPKELVDSFAALARAGQIEVTALPFQLHTEACSTEELHRQLRFTAQLERRHGFTTRSAMHTDVPGAVVGLVDALSAAGCATWPPRTTGRAGRCRTCTAATSSPGRSAGGRPAGTRSSCGSPTRRTAWRTWRATRSG